jgi:Peptidase C39 family
MNGNQTYPYPPAHRTARLRQPFAAAAAHENAGMRSERRPRVFVWLAPLLAAWCSACGVYIGSATTLNPQALTREPGWVAVQGVPLLRQHDEHDCGPTALTMVLNFWQPQHSAQTLALPVDRQVSVGELRDLARARGLSSFVVAGTPEDLVYELEHGRPAIVGVAKRTVRNAVTHYEVVVGMHKGSQRVATLDPAVGFQQNSFSGFLEEWQATGRVLLVVVPKSQQPAAAAASAP